MRQQKSAPKACRHAPKPTMPRTARKNSAGSGSGSGPKCFHVIVQGAGGERVFPDANFKGHYLTCLLEAKKKYPAGIIGFCVMDDHAHVLTCVEDVSQLSGFFKRANQGYARYYNGAKKRIGYVFAGRYKSETVEDKHLAYCLAHIHNNPLKAGTVSRAEDYRHSSYANYLTGQGIVDFDEAGALFDISADNMRAIMSQGTNWNWLEHKNTHFEDADTVFDELSVKFGLGSVRALDNVRLKLIAGELKRRCGLSNTSIGTLLNVSGETVRILLKHGSWAHFTSQKGNLPQA